MSRIPFLLVRTFDPAETSASLEERLLRHLGKLRGVDPFADDDAWERTEPETENPPMIHISDRHRIRQRIKRILEARSAISGFGRQKAEDRVRLEKLYGGVRLVTIASEARADEIAAQLHGQFPWLGPASESVWWSLRRSVRDGLAGVRLEPLLLDGPPGIGKSVWARHLAKLLGTPITEIDATNESASFGIVGSQRGWGNSTPGRVLSDILQHRVGNPLVVVDEIEKSGTPVSSKGRVFDLPSALLPLLEPATARRWTCPYHELPFDMGWIGWVLTSNDATLLPEPLLSRCPPLRLRRPAIPELVAFARREAARRNLSELAIEALVDVLEQPSWRQDPPSLRVVIRMLTRATDLENRPPLH